jgi:hypothetical protein
MHLYFAQDIGNRHVSLLHGLGGSGKTQIALKFLHETQSDRWGLSLSMFIYSNIKVLAGSQMSFSLMPVQQTHSELGLKILPSHSPLEVIMRMPYTGCLLVTRSGYSYSTMQMIPNSICSISFLKAPMATS